VNVLGVDLAWGDTRADGRPPNETGVVALAPDGTITDAGWTVGVAETAAWIGRRAESDAVLFVDAPLLVENATGQRACETEVGRRYGRWKVSANSSNLTLAHLAGVRLREALELEGWRYDDGHDGPSARGRTMSECYPYTALVGSPVLGYDTARPTYKRRPRNVVTADWRVLRAQVCDDLIARIGALAEHDPPIDLRSHPATAVLLDEQSPHANREYKHREDLLDACIAAWSAAVWVRHGFARSQVLGDERGPDGRPAATIITQCRPEQRRP